MKSLLTSLVAEDIQLPDTLTNDLDNISQVAQDQGQSAGILPLLTDPESS
jgi:hypothetical protein